MKMYHGKPMPDKVRTFVFTNYNMELDYEELIKIKAVAYVCYGDEVCPSSGRAHQQGWIHFHNPRAWTPKCLKKVGMFFSSGVPQVEYDKLSDEEKDGVYMACHTEPMGGSLAENDAYCSKVSVLKEYGNRPAQGARGDLKQVVDDIAKGEYSADSMAISDPVFYHMYGRTLSKAEDVALRKRFRTEMTKGIWYYGETGTGKSHSAFDGFDPETHYTKPLEDGWWDGYTGQGTLILNDYRGQLKYSEMLTLVDKWPHSVRRRNREPVPFLAHLVVVTSSLPPWEVYHGVAGNESLDQLYRRFDVVKVSGKDDKKVLTQNDILELTSKLKYRSVVGVCDTNAMSPLD